MWTKEKNGEKLRHCIKKKGGVYVGFASNADYKMINNKLKSGIIASRDRKHEVNKKVVREQFNDSKYTFLHSNSD